VTAFGLRLVRLRPLALFFFKRGFQTSGGATRSVLPNKPLYLPLEQQFNAESKKTLHPWPAWAPFGRVFIYEVIINSRLDGRSVGEIGCALYRSQSVSSPGPEGLSEKFGDHGLVLCPHGTVST